MRSREHAISPLPRSWSTTRAFQHRLSHHLHRRLHFFDIHSIPGAGVAWQGTISPSAHSCVLTQYCTISLRNKPLNTCFDVSTTLLGSCLTTYPTYLRPPSPPPPKASYWGRYPGRIVLVCTDGSLEVVSWKAKGDPSLGEPFFFLSLAQPLGVKRASHPITQATTTHAVAQLL